MGNSGGRASERRLQALSDALTPLGCPYGLPHHRALSRCGSGTA